MAEEAIANSTVLAVLSSKEDRASLARIFAGPSWKLRFARTLPQARTALSRCSVAVVISEASLAGGSFWKDLLREIQKVEDPPPLIVADRLADEHLWAEVLNLGAYDLLAKPFDAHEVLHAVSMACRRREDGQRIRRRMASAPAGRGGAAGLGPRAAFSR